MTHAAPSVRPVGLPARLVQVLVFRLVRLFYARIDVQGQAHLPGEGPVIYVLNHPNGILDPVLLMAALGRPVSFLAKSTLFGNPVGRWTMETFGALPVYRQRDKGLQGGSRDAGDMMARNEATFARCRALLHGGEALALFPEGTTHSGPELLPLRSGAARIALSAEAEAGWALGLRIVPVGLWYEDKTRFRTSVLVVVGEPFTLTTYAEAYGAEERQTVQAVTGRLDAGLDAVVLQAENAELLTAIPAIAAWTAPEGTAPDLSRRHAWAATLLAAYQRLHQTDPSRLERVAEKARRYASLLQALGVADPWRLEDPTVNRAYLARRVLGLVLLGPPALAGCLMSYAPYRLAGPVALRLVREDDTQTGTFKLIGGTLFVLVGWILEAALVGWLLGPIWGAGVFLVAPLLGYAALRWSEGWHRLRELTSYRRLRERRMGLVALLTERRRDLALDVVAAVESITKAS